MDKLGRRYWFIVRRLFVVDETEDDVRYYTTTKQLEEIIESLNENRHEKNLIENLLAQRDEIERQMNLTEDLLATLMKDHKKEDGTYSLMLGQGGSHRCYTNNYSSNHVAVGKTQPHDRETIRGLNNKFCMTNTLKWFGAINGHLNTITLTVRTTILKFESMMPQTFIHPCWQSKRSKWIKSVNNAQKPLDYAKALSLLESSIKPVLFKAAWYDCVGFIQLMRSTFLEREELKKIDRQPRGFERNERVSADFEVSYRLGTMVKFSPKLKPVKHQVWKQKGEEYRLTGLNGWYWRGITHRPRTRKTPKLYRNDGFKWSCSLNDHPFVVDMIEEKIKSEDVIDVATNLAIEDEHRRILYPKIPVHDSHRTTRIKKLESLLDIKLKEIEKKKAEAQEQIEKEKMKDSKPETNNAKEGTENMQHKPTNGLNQTPKNSPVKGENGGIKVMSSPHNILARNGKQQKGDNNNVSFNLVAIDKNQQVLLSKIAKPKLPPNHSFLTKRGRVMSLLVLPQLELNKLARSGGLKEARTFSYTAKPNHYIWPYGMTPRPTFRTCWLYRNQLVNSIQDVSLQLKVLYACIRWDDLQARPPASGHNTIVTDDSTITIELLKKRDRLPYLSHSEYLIRKTTTPTEQPTKYRKIGVKKATTPSARSGLRARRQVEEEDEKKPTKEELWVSEYQLELWELKQFDEKIERQNTLLRERALREEAERRRKLEEEKRRAAEQEKRRIKAEQEEATKKARLAQPKTPIVNYQNAKINQLTPQIPYRPNINSSINVPNQQLPGSQQTPPTTPVLRYFRTEQGQIIRLPASYLQRGTPLILRHVSPGTNQTNTYIIRPQATTTMSASPTGNNIGLRLVSPATILTQPSLHATTPPTTATPSTPATTAILATPATTPATTPTTAPATTTTISTATPTTTTTTATTAPAMEAATTATTTTTATTITSATISDTAEAVPIQTAPTAAPTTTTMSPMETAQAAPTATPTTIDATANAAPANEAMSCKQMQATLGASGDVNVSENKAAPAGPNEFAKVVSGDDNGVKEETTTTTTSVGTVANEMAHDQHAPSFAAGEADADARAAAALGATVAQPKQEPTATAAAVAVNQVDAE